jgi:hypothetical protein
MNAVVPPFDAPPTTVPPPRDTRTNEFLASEAFIPFVLNCFARGVSRAAMEGPTPMPTVSHTA